MPDQDPALVLEPFQPGLRRFDLSYGLVLALLIAALIMSAGAEHRFWRLLLTATLLAAVILTYRTTLESQRAKRVLTALSVPLALAAAASFSASSRLSPWVATLALVVLLVGLPLLILHDILIRHLRVTLETLLGALCVYMYVGFTAAFAFGFIDDVSSEPFFAQGPGVDMGDFFYFSFVTITTLGYGDLTPALDLGRQLAVLEAIVGQVYLVTLVARLVTMFRTERPEVPDLRKQRKPSPQS
jgi:hypothetical protein